MLGLSDCEEKTVSVHERLDTFTMLQAVAMRQSPRVAIKVEGSIIFINFCDVVAIQAEGNYVLLCQNSRSYLLREAISVVAEKLEPYGFIRIHRSVLVNTSFVEEIRPHLAGNYVLRVKGGKEYNVTRTYRQNLKSLAEFWIGTDLFRSIVPSP
jgi:DNA-binding LytR/AlgR family response regulator